MLTPDVIPNALAATAALLMWGTSAGMLFFSDWRITEAGRNYLALSFSMAALLTMNTIHLYVDPYPGQVFVRVLVYGALVVSSWKIGRTVWKAIMHGAPAETDDYVIVFKKREKSDA